MAYMDGSGHGNDTNVVPFALARLERLIQVRLAESLELGGDDPPISVHVYDEGPTDQAPTIPDDPQFYDAVVDKLVTTLDDYLDDVGHGAELSASALNEEIANAFTATDTPPRSCDRFVGRLRCMECGIVTDDPDSACETFLRATPDCTAFAVGDEFSFDHDEIARDYYAHATAPVPNEPVHVVEGWECPHCEAVNWAEIVLRDEIVSSVWSVTLTRDVLGRAHYVTSECVELAARITGRPAWSLLGDDVFEILFDELQAR